MRKVYAESRQTPEDKWQRFKCNRPVSIGLAPLIVVRFSAFRFVCAPMAHNTNICFHLLSIAQRLLGEDSSLSVICIRLIVQIHPIDSPVH